MVKDLSMAVLFDFYRGFLTSKQIEIMGQYYDQDLSLAEISENLEITRQGVRDSIKRAESLMLEMEEQVGAVRRHEAFTRLAKEIEGSMEVISDLALRSGAYRIIDEVQKLRECLGAAQGLI